MRLGDTLYFNSRGSFDPNIKAMWRVLPDHTAPTIAQFTHNVDQRTLNIRFTEHLGTSAALADFKVTRDSDGLEVFPTAFNYDPELRRVTLTLPPNVPDGEFSVSVLENSVFDVAGNALNDALPMNFHVLAGDANHDRSVDFADLLIVAQNYGQSNRTFSQGNVDYSSDNLVSFYDLLIVAQRYGTSLPQLPLARSFGSTRIGQDVLSIDSSRTLPDFR